jgi:hypothetical protein
MSFSCNAPFSRIYHVLPRLTNLARSTCDLPYRVDSADPYCLYHVPVKSHVLGICMAMASTGLPVSYPMPLPRSHTESPAPCTSRVPVLPHSPSMVVDSSRYRHVTTSWRRWGSCDEAESPGDEGKTKVAFGSQEGCV